MTPLTNDDRTTGLHGRCYIQGYAPFTHSCAIYCKYLDVILFSNIKVYSPSPFCGIFGQGCWLGKDNYKLDRLVGHISVVYFLNRHWFAVFELAAVFVFYYITYACLTVYNIISLIITFIIIKFNYSNSIIIMFIPSKQNIYLHSIFQLYFIITYVFKQPIL